MTTEEFAIKMHQINEIANYFALLGYHVTTTFNIKTCTCDLTVFYDDPKDKFLFLDHLTLEHSNLECDCFTSNNFKWVKMY